MAKKKPADKATKSDAKFLKSVGALVKQQADSDGMLTKEFSAAIDDVTKSIPKTDMGVEGMRLHVETMAFVVEAEKYDNRMDLDTTADVTDPPHDDFWRTLHATATEYTNYGKPPKTHRAPETVEYLVKTVENQGQVAQMLGLYTEAGTPDLARLQQEISKPGSVINDEWVHPDDAKDAVQRGKDHVKYVEELAAMKASPKTEDVCPETPEELYRTSVGIDQAVKMLALKPHRMTPEQVADKWVEFREKGIEQQGVPTTGRTGQPLTDYVATTGPTPEPTFTQTETPEVKPTEVEATVETKNDSIYAQSSETDLRELCEVAGISHDGKFRSEMIEALEEADKTQAGVGQ